MASGTLYTYPENVRAFKILIAAKYSGAGINVVQDPPKFKLGETNKTPEFLKKFPLGKVPAFENGNGTNLFESNAIAHYVSNDQLRGSDSLSQAQVQMFVNLADNEIEPAASTWVYPTLGVIQYNKQATEKAKEHLKSVLGFLDEYLKTRTFLVGERVSLADISVGCQLLQLYKQVLDPSFRQPYVNLNRWFMTFINQPEVKSVIGDVKLCEKMAQFDAKKFAELSGGGAKKDKKEKAPKQKQESKPKEQKKKEDTPPPAPKEKKDPFHDCPESAFDMDEFKRTISNNDVETVGLPYFWKNFDKNGYSIWFSKYLRPEYYLEGSKRYMTTNLIGGMSQRIEKLLKNAYSVMMVFGDDNNTHIGGVWFWRGQTLAFERSNDWKVDYESYEWTKLDPEADETKELVNRYFKKDPTLELEGRKALVDGDPDSQIVKVLK